VRAFPHAVFKRYGEDNDGWGRALISYYGFFSLFPRLVLFVTVAEWVPRATAVTQAADRAGAPHPVGRRRGRRGGLVKSMRITRRRFVGALTSVKPAWAKTCTAPTWSSPQVISVNGSVTMA
jgi:hypothetical protein